jgi:hypothetical protein
MFDCVLIGILAGSHLNGSSFMAKGLVVVPHSRKRKANAETPQECGIYDTAFLADRGCFFTAMHMKRKPASVRSEQRKEPGFAQLATG